MTEHGFNDVVEEQLGMTDSQGLRVIQVGLTFTCYFWDGHTLAVRKAVCKCVLDYLGVVGEEIHWVKHPETMAWLPVASPSLHSPESYLEALSPNRAWELGYHGGSAAASASDVLLEAFGSAGWKRRMSYFRCSVPVTWFADHQGCWQDSVLRWCEVLQPVHGYGGLGIIQSPNGMVMHQHEPAVYAAARRFLGLEFDDPVLHLPYVEQGIKGINWLTVLGREMLDRLGGLGALRRNLSPQVRVLEYDKGVVIQAGKRPELADRNRQIFPALYAEVAKAVLPIRITEHRAFQHAGAARFTRETSEEWLRRFDR